MLVMRRGRYDETGRSTGSAELILQLDKNPPFFALHTLHALEDSRFTGNGKESMSARLLGEDTEVSR
jgi:hypothetical protein